MYYATAYKISTAFIITALSPKSMTSNQFTHHFKTKNEKTHED